jgi:hypothetical protein
MLTQLIRTVTDMLGRSGRDPSGSQRLDRMRRTTPALAGSLGGATPMHYRAFTLLQARLQKNDTFFDGAHPDIVTFRERTKKVKEQTDHAVLAGAHRLLDNFAQLVDAFVPVWNTADNDGMLELYEIGQGDRARLREDMLRTVRLLDAELAVILASNPVTSDRFDVMQRYFEARYQRADDTPLSPVGRVG